MLARWRSGIFIAQGRQRGSDFRAGFFWLDHVIDIAGTGRVVRIVELAAVFFHEALAFQVWIARGLNLLPKEDIDRAFGAHDSNLGARPGVGDVGAQVLAAHHHVGAAVCFAGDDGDFRNGGFRKGVQDLGAVADDAAVFLYDPGQETGRIDKGDDAGY